MLIISNYASWFTLSRLAHGCGSFVAVEISWRKRAREGEGSGYHGRVWNTICICDIFPCNRHWNWKEVSLASALNFLIIRMHNQLSTKSSVEMMWSREL